MPHKVAALSHMDTLGPEVLEIGSMNTVVVTGFVDEDDGSRRPKLEGRNTDVDGIRGALLSSLPEEERTKDKPFGEGRSAIISASLCSVPPDAGELTAGCVAVGGGGTTRAAVYALSSMGLSPLWLINRDPVETAAIISTPAYARYDLRALEREEQWGEDEAERVACGVGAIPSFEPQTEGERNVYRLAERVFASSGSRSGRRRPLVRVFSCAKLGRTQLTDWSCRSSRWPTRCAGLFSLSSLCCADSPTPRSRTSRSCTSSHRSTAGLPSAVRVAEAHIDLESSLPRSETDPSVVRSLAGIEALIHQAFAQDLLWLSESPHTRLGHTAAVERLEDARRAARERVREAAGAPAAGH